MDDGPTDEDRTDAFDAHPGATVDRAVASMAARFPAHGDMLRMVAGALTWGEGVGMLSQARVQEWLWDRLPRKWPEEEWTPAAVAAGLLFDGLGLPRYAMIARSDTTRTVHDAWRAGSSRGFRAGRAAVKASGVGPPDTELLAWGSVFGMGESTAFSIVEWALEQAIVEGALVPGQPGWIGVASAITQGCLREPITPFRAGSQLRELVDPPSADDTPMPLLDLILRERAGRWVRQARSEPLAAWRAAIGPDLLTPQPAPSDAVIGDALEPMRWLLGALAGGVTLTQRGYLPVAVMRDGVERFGWWRWRMRPRSEADVFELTTLREAATRASLVAKRGKRLVTTRPGVRLLGDRQGLWRVLAGVAGVGERFEEAVADVLALRLLQGPAAGRALAAELAPMLASLGWRGGGEVVGEGHVSHVLAEVRGAWRLSGFLDEQRPRWEDGYLTVPDVIALTPLGWVSALQLLHLRATRPRTDTFG